MEKQIISMVVAVAQELAIGKDNQLLWHLPEDLKRFKAITLHKTVVMGRLTYFSLPEKFRPLKDRINVVLTTQKDLKIEGCLMVSSIEEILKNHAHEKEICIIGGASIYKQFLPYANKLYITKVEAFFEEADTFFPPINEEEWLLTEQINHRKEEKNPYDYSFLTYQKKGS